VFVVHITWVGGFRNGYHRNLNNELKVTNIKLY